MPLRYAVLGVLSVLPPETKLDKLAIKQEFDKFTGSFWDIQLSQIFSTLNSLERMKYVEKIDQVIDGEKNSVYQVTSQGIEAFGKWLREPDLTKQDVLSQIHLKLLYHRDYSAKETMRLLDAQKGVCEEQISMLNSLKSAASDSLDTYWLMIIEAHVMHLKTDIEWLEVVKEQVHKRSLLK